MEVNDVNRYITGFSGGLEWVTGGLSRGVTWLFTIQNIFFFLLLIGIGVVVYHMWRQDTLRRRYYFNRNREI